jgi:hypothetical protein
VGLGGTSKYFIYSSVHRFIGSFVCLLTSHFIIICLGRAGGSLERCGRLANDLAPHEREAGDGALLLRRRERKRDLARRGRV